VNGLLLSVGYIEVNCFSVTRPVAWRQLYRDARACSGQPLWTGNTFRGKVSPTFGSKTMEVGNSK
jgi:hypothetical protein